MLNAIAAPRRGNEVRTLTSCSGDLLAVAEARPRPQSLKLRPQSEVVIVVTLVRAPGEVSHAAGRDQQRRRRGALLLLRLAAMLAPAELKVAERTNHHDIILPHLMALDTSDRSYAPVQV
jgi:hypothetical protein